MIPEERPKRKKLQVGNDAEPFEAEIFQVIVVKTWSQILGEFTMMAMAALLAAGVAYYIFPMF